MQVYKAINAVQSDLARSGIGKDQTNTFDNYKFRGIDAVYNALAPLLAKHGLCVLPRMLSRTVEERQSQKGGALFYVTVEAEFDFVAAEDGSKHTVKTYGEAMDRGDKATNKAMSAAYKYAAFLAFAIPTEGDNDADAQTHEVRARSPFGYDRQAELDEMALYLIDCHQTGKDTDAIRLWYDPTSWSKDNPTESEERKYVWGLLKAESKLRSTIKANKGVDVTNLVTPPPAVVVP
jgi:hypothetical protein